MLQRRPLKIGFLPLNDCAPVVMAHELGLFSEYDLEVTLRREVSWQVIQDKVVHGELDAAHAPAAMPFAVNLNCRDPQDLCLTGLVLSLQGNAITLAHSLVKRGVNTSAALREEILRSAGRRTFTLGVPGLFTSQNFLLRQWLKSAGIHPDLQVRVVVVPPEQMFPNLRLDYLDGYCVGEPWTSLAVQAEAGCCVATSASLAPGHPEKVLMVRKDFAESRGNEHLRLIAAVLEACAFCDKPANRPHIAATLACRQYVNAPADCLQPGLVGPFHFGPSRTEPAPEFTIFARNHANVPTAERAAWLAQQILDVNGAGEMGRDQFLATKRAFRADLFYQAREILLSQAVEVESATSRTITVPI